MKDSTGNDLESITKPGEMVPESYCTPKSAPTSAWDAHCERHHKKERSLRAERDAALGKAADAEHRANDTEGEWRDHIIAAREARDEADRKLEVAELQLSEIKEAFKVQRERKNVLCNLR